MFERRPESPKSKLTPSHEIYNRILWDSRLNRGAFVIGYQDRLAREGFREKAFGAWNPNGDIPWHRIRYFRCGDVKVWDRDEHLDLFASDRLPRQAWATLPESDSNSRAAESVLSAVFTPRPVFRRGPTGWRPADEAAESVAETLTVACWNILSDLHEADRIRTSDRIPVILEHLRRTDADIIALQEATPAFLDALLAESWVRERFLSEAPAAPTIRPYGLLLLSKIPFSLVEHRYSAHKRALVAAFRVNGRPLNVGVVHLPSARAHDAVQARARHLGLLIDHLDARDGDCLVVGDFNAGDGELDDLLARRGFEDVWRTLNLPDAGFTFDPERNPLAAMMSLTGRPVRIDRMALRVRDGRWTARSMTRFGLEPIPGTAGELFPSDHFGLLAAFAASETPSAAIRQASPVYTSALVLVPPGESWPPIQAIRRIHDPKTDRWMPHVTLLYGFLPEEYFTEAVRLLNRALVEFEPFTVSLAGFDTFAHRSGVTAWLKPAAEPSDALHRLQAVLEGLFPQCDEQGRKSTTGFTPHLTVGRFRSAGEADERLSEWQPVSFCVDHVCLISRRADEPFEIRFRVPLGASKTSAEASPTKSDLSCIVDTLEPVPGLDVRARQETVISLVTQGCREVLESEPSVHVLGSARLGVQNPESDLDLLCLIPPDMPGERFLERLRERLAGLGERARVVTDAQVPVLRMSIDGLALDVLFANAGGLPLFDARGDVSLDAFDSISRQTLAGVFEADVLERVVRSHVPLESFQMLLRAVRAWTKARRISGNAWGFPGSFSWSLLAAWSATAFSRKDNDLRPEALLCNFFHRLTEHDWRIPVGLTEGARAYRVRMPRDRLPVVTSIEPHQNSARNISRSTARLLFGEFARASGLAQRIRSGSTAWDEVFEAADLSLQSNRFIVVTVSHPDPETFETACGRLEGRLFGLVLNLERESSVEVRPWPGVRKIGGKGSVVLGLRDAPDDGLTERVVSEFVASLESSGVFPTGTILERRTSGRDGLL